MSLDFSYANVQNSDEVMWDENDRMKPEIESIIFATMAVGINKITEDNYVIFFHRYCKYQISNGYGDPFFSLADVKSVIGLSTNASTKTDASFNKWLLDNLQRKADLYLKDHTHNPATGKPLESF